MQYYSALAMTQSCNYSTSMFHTNMQIVLERPKARHAQHGSVISKASTIVVGAHQCLKGSVIKMLTWHGTNTVNLYLCKNGAT